MASDGVVLAWAFPSLSLAPKLAGQVDIGEVDGGDDDSDEEFLKEDKFTSASPEVNPLGTFGERGGGRVAVSGH